MKYFTSRDIIYNDISVTSSSLGMKRMPLTHFQLRSVLEMLYFNFLRYRADQNLKTYAKKTPISTIKSSSRVK